MMDDNSLLLLIGENSEKGFQTLVNQFHKQVYWQVRRMVFSHDDADDITQDVFIKIYKNLANFKGEAKLSTWIHRIATNESINFINQKAKKNNVSFEEISYKSAENLENDAFFSGDEIQLKLQKAIAKLPEKQRIVFNMKYYEELKYEEISEILQTSVGALKASYHLAVKKIEDSILNH